VASQYIAKQIEIDRPASAAAVSVALLLISFAVLFVIRFATRSKER
jgi:sulfate transport system permease protein